MCICVFLGMLVICIYAHCYFVFIQRDQNDALPPLPPMPPPHSPLRGRVSIDLGERLTCVSVHSKLC